MDRSKTGKFGWDDIREMQEAGTLPAASTVNHHHPCKTTHNPAARRPAIASTPPISPFALASREADYRVAWAFFQSSAGSKVGIDL